MAPATASPWMTPEQPRQFLDRVRRDIAPPAGFDVDALATPDLPQAADQLPLARDKAVFGGARSKRLLRGVDDRRIPGAAAKIAGQQDIDRVALRLPFPLKAREQRHHETGCAETALRGVMLDHRLLDRVEIAVALEVLDRDQGLAVEHAHELNAAVDRPIPQPAVLEVPDNGGARAAIAFGASLLGAGQPLRLAQITKHGQRRIDRIEPPDLAVEYELDGLSHARLPSFQCQPDSACTHIRFGRRPPRSGCSRPRSTFRCYDFSASPRVSVMNRATISIRP